MRGHIEQRSKGSYAIWVELPRDPVTGRRRRQTLTVHGTKKDAERKLAEHVQQVDSGGYLRPSKATVGEFLRQWLADYAATHVRPRTLEGYRRRIECHLIPALGEVPLTQLQAADLNKYYADELARGRKDGKGGGLFARSVLDHHRLLHEALSHAVKWGLVGRNVAQAVDPPRPGKKEMRTLDAAGVEKLLEAAKNTPYDFHDLRHTHASLMLRQGIHPKVVSERLGHSSISITLDTCSHVTPGLQEAAAKRFDEALSAGPQQAGTSIR